MLPGGLVGQGGKTVCRREKVRPGTGRETGDIYDVTGIQYNLTGQQ
jgi:hypothetical protein